MKVKPAKSCPAMDNFLPCGYTVKRSVDRNSVADKGVRDGQSDQYAAFHRIGHSFWFHLHLLPRRAEHPERQLRHLCLDRLCGLPGLQPFPMGFVAEGRRRDDAVVHQLRGNHRYRLRLVPNPLRYGFRLVDLDRTSL